MSRIAGWLGEAEAKLDEWGRGAWIAAMVLGFIVFWPLGLLLLFYMIWSGRMGCSRHRTRWHRNWARPTGNTAFDEYREQTLRRLEEEQGAFEAFLGKLRKAKDQAEFDQFMEERHRGAGGNGNGNGNGGGNGDGFDPEQYESPPQPPPGEDDGGTQAPG
jgi:uncharacterized membrane protein YgcG